MPKKDFFITFGSDAAKFGPQLRDDLQSAYTEFDRLEARIKKLNLTPDVTRDPGTNNGNGSTPDYSKYDGMNAELDNILGRMKVAVESAAGLAGKLDTFLSKANRRMAAAEAATGRRVWDTGSGHPPNTIAPSSAPLDQTHPMRQPLLSPETQRMVQRAVTSALPAPGSSLRLPPPAPAPTLISQAPSRNPASLGTIDPRLAAAIAQLGKGETSPIRSTSESAVSEASIGRITSAVSTGITEITKGVANAVEQGVQRIANAVSTHVSTGQPATGNAVATISTAPAKPASGGLTNLPKKVVGESAVVDLEKVAQQEATAAASGVVQPTLTKGQLRRQANAKKRLIEAQVAYDRALASSGGNLTTQILELEQQWKDASRSFELSTLTKPERHKERARLAKLEQEANAEANSLTGTERARIARSIAEVTQTETTNPITGKVEKKRLDPMDDLRGRAKSSGRDSMHVDRDYLKQIIEDFSVEGYRPRWTTDVDNAQTAANLRAQIKTATGAERQRLQKQLRNLGPSRVKGEEIQLAGTNKSYTAHTSMDDLLAQIGDLREQYDARPLDQKTIHNLKTRNTPPTQDPRVSKIMADVQQQMEMSAQYTAAKELADRNIQGGGQPVARIMPRLVPQGSSRDMGVATTVEEWLRAQTAGSLQGPAPGTRAGSLTPTTADLSRIQGGRSGLEAGLVSPPLTPVERDAAMRAAEQQWAEMMGVGIERAGSQPYQPIRKNKRPDTGMPIFGSAFGTPEKNAELIDAYKLMRAEEAQQKIGIRSTIMGGIMQQQVPIDVFSWERDTGKGEQSRKNNRTQGTIKRVVAEVEDLAQILLNYETAIENAKKESHDLLSQAFANGGKPNAEQLSQFERLYSLRQTLEEQQQQFLDRLGPEAAAQLGSPQMRAGMEARRGSRAQWELDKASAEEQRSADRYLHRDMEGKDILKSAYWEAMLGSRMQLGVGRGKGDVSQMLPGIRVDTKNGRIIPIDQGRPKGVGTIEGLFGQVKQLTEEDVKPMERTMARMVRNQRAKDKIAEEALTGTGHAASIVGPWAPGQAPETHKAYADNQAEFDRLRTRLLDQYERAMGMERFTIPSSNRYVQDPETGKYSTIREYTPAIAQAGVERDRAERRAQNKAANDRTKALRGVGANLTDPTTLTLAGLQEVALTGSKTSTGIHSTDKVKIDSLEKFATAATEVFAGAEKAFVNVERDAATIQREGAAVVARNRAGEEVGRLPFTDTGKRLEVAGVGDVSRGGASTVGDVSDPARLRRQMATVLEGEALRSRKTPLVDTKAMYPERDAAAEAQRATDIADLQAQIKKARGKHRAALQKELQNLEETPVRQGTRAVGMKPGDDPIFYARGILGGEGQKGAVKYVSQALDSWWKPKNDAFDYVARASTLLGKQNPEPYRAYDPKLGAVGPVLQHHMSPEGPNGEPGAPYTTARPIGGLSSELSVADVRGRAQQFIGETQIKAVRESLAKAGIRWSATFNESLNAAKTVEELFAEIQRLGENIKMMTFTGTQRDYTAGATQQGVKKSEVIGTPAEWREARTNVVKEVRTAEAELQGLIGQAGLPAGSPFSEEKLARVQRASIQARANKYIGNDAGLTKAEDEERQRLQKILALWDDIEAKVRGIQVMDKAAYSAITAGGALPNAAGEHATAVAAVTPVEEELARRKTALQAEVLNRAAITTGRTDLRAQKKALPKGGEGTPIGMQREHLDAEIKAADEILKGMRTKEELVKEIAAIDKQIKQQAQIENPRAAAISETQSKDERLRLREASLIQLQKQGGVGDKELLDAAAGGSAPFLKTMARTDENAPHARMKTIQNALTSVRRRRAELDSNITALEHGAEVLTKGPSENLSPEAKKLESEIRAIQNKINQYAHASAMRQVADILRHNVTAGPDDQIPIDPALRNQALGIFRPGQNASRGVSRAMGRGNLEVLQEKAAKVEKGLADTPLADLQAELAHKQGLFASMTGGAGGGGGEPPRTGGAAGAGDFSALEQCCKSIVTELAAIHKTLTTHFAGRGKGGKGDQSANERDVITAAGTSGKAAAFTSRGTVAGQESAIATIQDESIRKAILEATTLEERTNAVAKAVVKDYINMGDAANYLTNKEKANAEQAQKIKQGLRDAVGNVQTQGKVDRGNAENERRAKREFEDEIRRGDAARAASLAETGVAETMSKVSTAAQKEVEGLRAAVKAKASDEEINKRLQSAYNALGTSMDKSLGASAQRQKIREVLSSTGAPVGSETMKTLAANNPEAIQAAKKTGNEIGNGMGQGAMSGFESTMFGNHGFWSRVIHSTGTFLVRNFTAGFVFGLTNALQEILRQAIETEAVFVRVSNALDATGRSAGDLRSQLVSISADYGTSLESVYNTAASLTGMFQTTDDITQATRIISELDMISGGALSAGEGVGALASITSAYGISGVQGLSHVADVLTVIQNQLGSNIEVSAEGLGRLAGQTHQLGIEMEDAMTYVSAIAKLTNQQGSAAGEQFQRIIAVMQSGKGQAVLRKTFATQISPEGKTMADALTPDKTTGMLDYNAAMKIMLANYKDLSSVEQNRLTVTLGGSRQQAALNGLLQQGNRVLEVAAAAHKANGDAAERAANMAEQMNAQLKILQTDLVSMGANLVRSGLLNFFGALLKATTMTLGVVVEFMSKLNDLADRTPFLSFLRGSTGFMIGLVGAVWLGAKAFTGMATAMRNTAAMAKDATASLSTLAAATQVDTVATEENVVAQEAFVMNRPQRMAAEAAAANGSAAAASALVFAGAPPKDTFLTRMNARTTGLAERAAAYGGDAALALSSVSPLTNGTSNSLFKRLLDKAQGGATSLEGGVMRYKNDVTGIARAELKAMELASKGAATGLRGVSRAMEAMMMMSTGLKVGLASVAAVGLMLIYDNQQRNQNMQDLQDAADKTFGPRQQAVDAGGNAIISSPTPVRDQYNKRTKEQESIGPMASNPFNNSTTFWDIYKSASYMTSPIGILKAGLQGKTPWQAMQDEYFNVRGDLTSTDFTNLGQDKTAAGQAVGIQGRAPGSQRDIALYGIEQAAVNDPNRRRGAQGGTVEAIMAAKKKAVDQVLRTEENIRQQGADGKIEEQQMAHALAIEEETMAQIDKVATAQIALIKGIVDGAMFTVDVVDRIDQYANLMQTLSNSPYDFTKFQDTLKSLATETGVAPGSEMDKSLQAMATKKMGRVEFMTARMKDLEAEAKSLDAQFQSMEVATDERDAVEKKLNESLQGLATLSQQLLDIELQGYKDQATLAARRGDRKTQHASIQNAVATLYSQMRPNDKQFNIGLWNQINALWDEDTQGAIRAATRKDVIEKSTMRGASTIAEKNLEIARKTLEITRSRKQAGLASQEALDAAIASENQATIAVQDAHLADMDARRQTAIARIAPGDSIGLAAGNLDAAKKHLADIAKFYKPGTSEYESALQNVIRSSWGTVDAAIAMSEANSQFAIAVDQAQGKLVKAAVDSTAAARQKLADALKKSGGAMSPEVRNAQAGVITAEAAQRDAVLNDKLGTIDFNMQMNRMTSASAIAALKDILKTSDLTRQQRRDILLKIKGLTKELNGPWNLGDIQMPTPYDMRRYIMANSPMVAQATAITQEAGYRGGSAGDYYGNGQVTARQSRRAAADNVAAAAAAASDSGTNSNRQSITIYVDGTDVGMVKEVLRKEYGAHALSTSGTRTGKG